MGCVKLYSMYLNPQKKCGVKKFKNIFWLVQKFQWLVANYLMDWFYNKNQVFDFYFINKQY
jgi:hypothetical protein